MARNKKQSSQSITKYLEEKRSKRIDPAQLTIISGKESIDNIEKTNSKLKIPKERKKKLLEDIEYLKNETMLGTNIKEDKNIPRKIYDFIFGWLLTKKTETENIFQHSIRQLLPPDSSGKPSWQLFIVLWALVIMSYVTAAEIQVALSWVVTYSEKGQVLTKKMHGFSEAFIYFIMIFGGVVSGLFYKREKDRKAADGANAVPDAPGMLTAVKERISSFISKK